MKSRHNRRLFRRNRRRRSLLLAVGAVIVAGCAQTVADWTPQATSADLQVKWVTHEHSINFANRANSLTNQEARSLDRFLSEIDLRPSDRLFVEVAPQSGEGVSENRVGVINQQLRRRIPNAEAVEIAATAGSPGEMRLIVGRYVVLPPNCPDHSRPTASNPGNQPDSNLGCSTQHNLGLMLADPGDLLRGRTLGPGDAQMLSKTYSESRDGEVAFPHISSKHLRR